MDKSAEKVNALSHVWIFGKSAAGRIRPAGRTLETPGLDVCFQSTYCVGSCW